MASGTFWTAQRPKTREQIAQVAARDVLLTAISWTAGAVVIWGFSNQLSADPVAQVLITLFVAAVVPLGLLAVMRRDVSWLRGRGDREGSTSIAVYVVLYSAMQVLIWALLPYLDGWTPIHVWSAFYLWGLLVTMSEAGLRYARPGGWTGMLVGGSRIVPIVLLVTAVSIFMLMWVVADGMVAGARQPCDPTRFLCLDASSQAWEAAVGPAWFGGWSVAIVAAFALRLRFIAVGAVAMAAFGYGLWAQQVSKEIDLGATVIAEPLTLIVAQLGGVIALLGAAAVIQVYEQRERTPRELRLLGWFGAKRSPTGTRSGDLPS